MVTVDYSKLIHDPSSNPPSSALQLVSSATFRPNEARLSSSGEASRMNQQLNPKQDFESSPPSCPGLEYLDIPATGDMRYNQDSNISSLTIETPPQPSSVLSGFSAPLLNTTTTGYSPDTGSFYSSASQIFPGIDVRPPRLSSNSTSSTGMAHANRSAPLPNPAYNVRDLYSGARPSFGRPTEHTRSPSFAAPLRRHPLSPTPSPNISFTSPVRMDTSQYGKSGGSHIPPLLAMSTNGQLVYSETGAPIKIDIHGTIDKGFFMSEGDWTCYRRNYFSCICSYSLSPYSPNTAMQYVPSGSSSSYQVFGFAMCISAVVSDSDSHTIDLVQHTPKRDKGPVQKPEKVRLTPKQPQQTPHPLLYQDHHAMAGATRPMYESSFGQSTQGSYPSEHTFERIQFKQATANNGKRRAAQQYYHLVVELYADVGNQGQEQFMKIASRKSAKMIVRGRSPGHYQTERRGSASSGPGGSGGMGGYSGSQVLGPDYGGSGGPSLLSGSYPSGGGYDPRSGHYGGTRHHELPAEPIIPTEDAKAIDTTREYQYYPAPIYEGADSGRGIEMFSHRGDPESLMTSTPSTNDSSSSKVKHEYEGPLPSILYNPGNAFYRGCSRFEGKPTSTGYYPTMPTMLPQSG